MPVVCFHCFGAYVVLVFPIARSMHSLLYYVIYTYLRLRRTQSLMGIQAKMKAVLAILRQSMYKKNKSIVSAYEELANSSRGPPLCVCAPCVVSVSCLCRCPCRYLRSGLHVCRSFSPLPSIPFSPSTPLPRALRRARQDARALLLRQAHGHPPERGQGAGLHGVRQAILLGYVRLLQLQLLQLRPLPRRPCFL